MKVFRILFVVFFLLEPVYSQADARYPASQIGPTAAVDCSVSIELSEGTSASGTLKDNLKEVGQVMCMDHLYYLRTPKLVLAGVSENALCVFQPIEKGSRILIDTSREWNSLELISCMTKSLEAFRVEVDLANGYYTGYKICPNAQASLLALGGFNRMVWFYNMVSADQLDPFAVDEARSIILQSKTEAINSCLLADEEAI